MTHFHRQTLRVEPEQLKRWQDAAYEARLDLSSFIRRTMEAELDRLERERQEREARPAPTMRSVLDRLDGLAGRSPR